MRYESIKQLRAVWMVVSAVCATAAMVGSLVERADAIPAFARKHNMACNNCHAVNFPKLNDFGNRFRDQGYQLGSDEDLPSETHFAFWPVSIRTTVGYQYATASKLAVGNPATSQAYASSSSLGFTGLDLLAFGTLARDVSYGVVYVPGLGGAGVNTGSTASGGADLEYAFVRFNNIMGNSLLNFRIGKHEIDLPFSEKRSPTLNSVFVAYHYQAGTAFGRAFTNPAGNPTYANANDFALGDNQLGIELMGWKDTDVTDGTFRYSVNLLSNAAVNQGTSGGGRNLIAYGHLTQSFKGYGFTEGHRVGLFGMFGQAPTAANPALGATTNTGAGRNSKTFSRIGADVSTTALQGDLNVFGMAMYAKDSRDLFASQGVAAANAAEWHGGFLEADYTVSGPWVAYYRFDWIRNRVQGDQTFAKNFGDVDSHTLAVRQNFLISKRLGAAWHTEYTNTRTKGTGAFGGDQIANLFFTGVDFAF